MIKCGYTLLVLGCALCASSTRAASDDYFRIEVVDDQTGRGVPFVELSTTTHERFFTDSNGLIALDAPELLGRSTWFNIASHGYEFPADGFGFRGARLTPKLGESATLKIKRLNIAERLYRVTGAGIYRDTVLLGEKPPIDQPLLNAEVAGQDSVVAAIYKGKIFWVWGDTARLSYALGHFATAAATSDLPGRSGLDPSIGINLNYFVDSSGFSKGVVPLGRPGPVWTDGLVSVKDDAGRERLVAHYVRVKELFSPVESGLAVFNDQTEQFDVIKQIDLESPLAPGSHPFRVNVDGEEHIYFPGYYLRPMSYAPIRVRAGWQSLLDLSQYEAFTCLKPGTRYDKADPPLDRSSDGKLIWAWKRDTAALTEAQLRELVEAGHMARDESPLRLTDIDTGEALRTFGGSIQWNEYRKRWILITVNAISDEVIGGDVYFAEANAPEGPWVYAKKIATHSAKDDDYDFYNPVHHTFYDQQGGRLIYFQGTLSTFFSKNRRAAPRYSYNQLMYRLDLADPRLNLPAPPPALSNVQPGRFAEADAASSASE
jgi:hypothetical protein